jgi:signal transduction histidine kinase
VTRDLTERREREERLRRMGEDLEKRVLERTTALAAANERLEAEVAERRRAEQLLKAADRRKNDFLAMLAHELRNPLAPLRSALQVIQLSNGGTEVLARAQSIMERQVQHLSRIVDDLLDVSRIERGRVSLRRERIDLARLAQTASGDHRSEFEVLGLKLLLHLPETPIWIDGDGTRLTQVIGNLLQNAMKFTDRGGEIHVRVVADHETSLATLSVSDSGIGIAPEMLSALFEPFSQADRSLDRSKGGLGLGLALVKGLVELHGGEVRALSQGLGCGTEFVVQLPLQPEPAALGEAADLNRSEQLRLRVLIVEDNLDAAESLKIVLELYGCEVAIAYTGPTGVQAAQTMHPDIVLCDIGLPGLDGYGVIQQLRRNPKTASARVIAITGYGGEDDRRKSEAAGFDAHLTKPADLRRLHELLSHKR